MNRAGRPVMLVACFDGEMAAWARLLTPAADRVELRLWPDAGAVEEVDYIVAWANPPGFFDDFTGLKAIFWTGAGVDRLLFDPKLPNVPITRLVDPSLTQGMVEFVAERVLHYHRLMPTYAAQQRDRKWAPLTPPLARDRTVGVLGLGELGGACATTLAGLGFTTRGWSRSPKSLAGVDTFTGSLAPFLEGCDALVCLLPLTPETEGVLNADLFAHLNGAWLINVGRGAHLVEEDLIPALDAGHLAAASLDVFRTEPLADDHPFWTDPRIVVTPHASGLTRPSTAAANVLANLDRALAGQPLQDQVDPARGY